MLVASAPNGAYKTRRDHAAIPLTAGQLADTAAQVLQAGARMLHLHVRDSSGRHTLDDHAYGAAIAAIRARVGGQLLIQCTSEAAGIYAAAGQRRAVRRIISVDGVDGVSLAVRELAGSDADAQAAGALFHRLAERSILAQYILYSAADIDHYAALRERDIIPAGRHSVLLVVGQRNAERSSVLDTLRRMAGALPAAVPWMACAFGEHEFECLTEATRLGGHVRVGFENSLRLRCGRAAADNRQLVAQFTESGNPHRRPLADLRQARAALGGGP
ncbi:MAG: 3-keto-5-aminohexanoate cleavage protein [Gammaproteobacteria bacterium]|nr:3-keto-5-aminohexanoate cleavage protein [Gammaproteobacteria bacterium]